MSSSEIDEETLKKACVKFESWFKKSEDMLRPLVNEANNRLMELFTKYPDIKEFKYELGGITYVIKREAFMKKQLSKKMND